ncbi:MAG: hypothetical protein FWG62_00165 [Proteobacteria bacterium]|nr:hypothetical protein [Pseudomonadota bacterium]
MVLVSIVDFAIEGNRQSTENTVVADLVHGYNDCCCRASGASENIRKTTTEENMEIDWAYLRQG